MALLQPDSARIGRPPGDPAEDRVPDELASGTPPELSKALADLIGADQVLDRTIDLIRYASDASPEQLGSDLQAPRHLDPTGAVD